MSARKAALLILKSRLQHIKTSNGFNSDAGAALFLGERPVLGDGDPDAAISMMPQADIPGSQMTNVVTVLPVEVAVIVKADADDPFGTVEDIIADVKKAVETDHDLSGTLLKQRGLERGPVTPHDREAGSTFVGASIEYRLTIAEGWGSP